jgi:putative acetyltransferase
MNIRPLEKDDLPEIFEIYAQSKLDELRYEENDFELIHLEHDAKRWPKIKESDIYVCEDESILGFGAIFNSEIRALYVSPNARSQGVGKLLLEHLLSKSNGDTSLWVTSSNKPAMRLYEKHGFKSNKEFLTDYNGQDVLVNKMVRSNTKT